jgi:hypothetical protein
VSELLPRDTLVAIAEQAIAELESPNARRRAHGEPHEIRRARELAEFGADASAIVAAAALLAEARDPIAARFVIASYPYDGYDDRFGADGEALATALELLVKLAGERALDAVKKLVLPGKTRVPLPGRVSIASALAPHAARSEAVRELLYAMHADEDDRVRAEVRTALGGHAPPPWWGVFERDPLRSLSPEDARRLRKPLERALEIAGHERHEWKKEMPALRRAMRALPDDVAMPILTRLCLREGFFDRVLLRRWIVAKADDDPNPIDLLFRARGRDLETLLHPERVAAALDGAPRELRARIALRLFDTLTAGTRESLPLAEVALALLPGDLDPREPFERLAGCPAERAADDGKDASKREIGGAAWTLVRWLQLHERLGTLLAPALDAHARDFPRTWHDLGGAVEGALLATKDDRVRAYAERALAGSDDRATRFALLYLTGAGRDPARDAPPEELLESAIRSPRLRSVIAHDRTLGTRALGALSRELAGGRLGPSEIAASLETLRAAEVTLDDDTRRAVHAALEPLARGAPVTRELSELLRAAASSGLVERAYPGYARLREAWLAAGERGEALGNAYVFALAPLGESAREALREVCERGPSSVSSLARILLQRPAEEEDA